MSVTRITRYNSTGVLDIVTVMKKDVKADHTQISELKWIQTVTISIIRVDFEDFIGANPHALTSNAAITEWNINKR